VVLLLWLWVVAGAAAGSLKVRSQLHFSPFSIEGHVKIFLFSVLAPRFGIATRSLDGSYFWSFFSPPRVPLGSCAGDPRPALCEVNLLSLFPLPFFFVLGFPLVTGPV